MSRLEATDDHAATAPVASSLAGPTDIASPSTIANGRFQRFLRIYAVVPALFLLAVAAADFLPLAAAGKQDVINAFAPPVFAGGSMSHPLGTDELGRDILSRLLHGGQYTFVLIGSAVLIGTLLGAVLGVLAGSARGAWDVAISRLIDAQLALPVILLALVIVTAGGQSTATLVFVFATISWAQCARVVRAEVLSLSEQTFVTALTVAGVGRFRMMWRHLLPNLMPTIAVLAMLQTGTLLIVESALSYLGLGVASPHISWGSMLADGRSYMLQSWWIIGIPGIAISLAVLHINIGGDALRSRLDPTLRGRS
jgi:peptide/nickel transport system permease protein